MGQEVKALLVLGGLCLAVGVSLGLPAVSRYAEERSAWRDVREDLELGGYDAALSDSLYETSEETRMDVEWAGIAVALGWLLLLAGWTPQKEFTISPRPWQVTLIDGMLAWSIFLLCTRGEDLGLWDTRESALAAALSSAASLLFFLPYAPLLAGRSLGLALTGGGLPKSRAIRLRALLFAPFSLPILLVSFWVRGRFSWLKAVHLPISRSNPAVSPQPKVSSI